MKNPAVVFGFMGAYLWATTGFVAGTAYYAPTMGWQAVKQNHANVAVSGPLLSAIWTTCILSMIVGALYGQIILALYRSESPQARRTRAPTVAGSPPQSIAEVTVTMRSLFLSSLFGMGIAFVVPPLLAHDPVTINPLPVRLLMGAITACVGGVLVLPYSLKRVTHIPDRLARPRAPSEIRKPVTAPTLASADWRTRTTEPAEPSATADSTRNWQRQTVGPTREAPPKANIRNPSPGLARLLGMIFFLAASLGGYYGGLAVFNLPALDWAAPVWTGMHLFLVVTCALLGCIAGILGQGIGLCTDVGTDRANDFFITIWQFLANGSMVWLVVVGSAMSLALGREEAQALVIRIGAERVTYQVLGIGAALSLGLGLAHFIARTLGVPYLLYLIASLAAILSTSRWYLGSFGIHGPWWVGVGFVILILLIPTAQSMIARDHQQRNIILEQFESESKREQ